MLTRVISNNLFNLFHDPVSHFLNVLPISADIIFLYSAILLNRDNKSKGNHNETRQYYRSSRLS